MTVSISVLGKYHDISILQSITLMPSFTPCFLAFHKRLIHDTCLNFTLNVTFVFQAIIIDLYALPITCMLSCQCTCMFHVTCMSFRPFPSMLHEYGKPKYDHEELW